MSSLFDQVPIRQQQLALIPSFLSARSRLSLGALCKLDDGDNNSGKPRHSTAAVAKSDPGAGGGSLIPYSPHNTNQKNFVGPVWQVNPLEAKVVLPFSAPQPSSSSSSNSQRHQQNQDEDDEEIAWKNESARSAQQVKSREQVARRLQKSHVPFRPQDPSMRRHSPVHSVKEGMLALPQANAGAYRRQKQNHKISLKNRRTFGSTTNSNATTGDFGPSGSDTDGIVEDDRVPIHAHSGDAEWPTFIYDDGTFAPAMLPAIARPAPTTLWVQNEHKALVARNKVLERIEADLQRHDEQEQHQQHGHGLVVKGKHRKTMMMADHHRTKKQQEQQQEMQRRQEEADAVPSSQCSSSSTPASSVAPAPPPVALPHTGRVFRSTSSAATHQGDQLQLPSEYSPRVPVRDSARDFLKRGSATKPPPSDCYNPNFGINPATARTTRTVVGQERPGAMQLSVSNETCGFRQSFLYRLGDLGRN